MLFLICKLYNYLKNNSLKNQNKRPIKLVVFCPVFQVLESLGNER